MQTIQHNTNFYNTIQYNTIQNNMYNTTENNNMQCQTMQHYISQNNKIQCKAMQCKTKQYDTIQYAYRTIPYNTITCNTSEKTNTLHARSRSKIAFRPMFAATITSSCLHELPAATALAVAKVIGFVASISSSGVSFFSTCSVDT